MKNCLGVIEWSQRSEHKKDLREIRRSFLVNSKIEIIFSYVMSNILIYPMQSSYISFLLLFLLRTLLSWPCFLLFEVDRYK